LETVLRLLAIMIMVLLRLAVVMSLAGYTMSNANAAMHGSAYADVTASVGAQHHNNTHNHGAEVGHADTGHHDGAEVVKKDCCQDFCFSVALPASCQTSRPLLASSALRLGDDSRIHGTRPSLHRPPNI
jgi:predicted 2-oxoglutarate/Fe(II)-dependent dioxygenase YbiX